jgi:hypothetical protein
MVVAIVLLPLILSAVSNRTWLGKLASAGKGLFLDSQTNTYSLSKIQLYLWLLAAIFGWVYLTACLSLVQGRFDFAPLPKNMPGILLFSLGTTTLAGGISHSRPKGAGKRAPSISDLVTSGGVVVPERVQFLVWTLLGFGAFLMLVLSSDPSTIQELPAVPEEFLYVMGLSSAGYLGGKLVRQPGPILSGATLTSGSAIITLCGRNLSTDSNVSINDVAIMRPWLLKMSPQIVEPDEMAGYGRSLRFTVPDASLVLHESRTKAFVALPNGQRLEAPFKLWIANPDGQGAELDVEVAGLRTPPGAEGSRQPLRAPTIRVSPKPAVT